MVSPDDDLRIVVPAVEQSRLQWLANDEDAARAEARATGETLSAEAPTDATTIDVKPDPPTQVLRDAVREHQPERIVVALRSDEDATWLEEHGLEDLPDEIDGVPVVRMAL
ncbi:MAG TPA: hypothetical protein VFU99_05970 [Gaiellaceae bacterium]|nr:hypothetical protein [Gaiellaceae bacterium]